MRKLMTLLMITVLSALAGCQTDEPVELQVDQEVRAAAVRDTFNGNWYNAKLHWHELVEDHPEYAEGLYNLGLCYMNLRDPQRSRDAYQAALEIEPENTKARFQLAVIHIQLRENERAHRLLLEVTEQDPYYHLGWYNLALMERVMQRPVEAREAMDRCLELVEDEDPRDTQNVNEIFELDIQIFLDAEDDEGAWSRAL